MFNKNNLKYILILALGFFWCSSVYLTEEQYLSKLATVNYVNVVELLFGSFSMALGILIFAILYRRTNNIKKYYITFTILALIFAIIFFSTNNITLMDISLCLTCLFGTAGFGAGYHFSLLGANVERKYRGRVFALGYGLGSVGTYLLILLPESFYSTELSLILYVPVILLTLFLVLKYTSLEVIVKEKFTKTFKSHFLKLSIIVLAMAVLSALSTDSISLHTITIAGGYGGTRLYYCIGLLIAGFLVDKKQEIFEMFVLISFIFSLLAVILLNENYSINTVAAISYFFIGFFVLFRTMSFVNLVDRSRNILFASCFGLMYSRIMEGTLVFFEDKLLQNYIILVIVISISLAIVISLYFLLYFRTSKMTESEIIKSLVVKHNLTLQEEKVLNLLIQGKSNQEMADELYISLFTIKRHVASIYKKTKMNKRELIEKCYIGL